MTCHSLFLVLPSLFLLQTFTTGRKVTGEDHGMPTTETEGSSPALFLDPSCHIAQVGLSSSSINAHPFRVPARLLGPLTSTLYQGCHPKPLSSTEASSSSHATIIFFQTVPRELCPSQPKKASGCLWKKGLSWPRMPTQGNSMILTERKPVIPN